MKRVFLHGDLKRRFCDSVELDVSDTTELMHALDANFYGFNNHILRRHIDGHEYAFLNKSPNKITDLKDFQENIISKDSDHILTSEKEEIHIVPFSSGAGFVTAFFTALKFSGTYLTVAVAVTWAAIIQVAMNILFKPPKQTQPKVISTRSMILNAKANSTSQGIPVPVGYGRLRVGAANILTYQTNRTVQNEELDENKGLESASEVEFLDLISEGPIGGLANENGLPVEGSNINSNLKEVQTNEEYLKGIYLNDTPVVGAHGFKNYILNEEGSHPKLLFGANEISDSIINRTSYMKNYDLNLIGPSYENLENSKLNHVLDTHGAAYLEAKDSIDQSALPISHKVYNENVDIVTFSLTSRQQHQDNKGNTKLRDVFFSINYAFGLDSSSQEVAVGAPIQNDFTKQTKRDNFFSAEQAPENNQFYIGDAIAGSDYGIFDNFTHTKEVKSWKRTPKHRYSYTQSVTKTVPIFHVKGIASGPFQFDISVRFNEETKRKIKNEGITFRILKHSIELNPAAKSNLGGIANVQELKLNYVQEVTAANFGYPNSAICRLMVDGNNFSSTPERTYHVFLKKVLIPSNYDPVSRTYDGAWDGSFNQSSVDQNTRTSELGDSHRRWTNNPAWIYYDLITNTRFGLGRNGVDNDFVNKWQLYKISKYCDELVSTNYPIETTDGNLVHFILENDEGSVDSDGQFTILLTDSQHNKGDLNTYNRFEDDFGKDVDFAGKIVAFFLGENVDINDSSKNLKIYQRELKRVNGNRITLRGPSLPEGIGKCALQKNHKIVEPRFSCNLYLNEKSEALDIINKLSSVFRSINSYLGGKIYAVQDVPQDPIQIFNNSNVANGEFNYSTADKKRRITACVVQFVNEDKNYDVDSVYEEDSFAMQRFGFVQEEIVGFGVTSPSQARRLAKWNLIASQSENEIIKFNVSQEGAYLYPNSIIEVSDENRISKEKSGRIKSMGESYTKISGGSEIVIDKPYFELDKDITKTPNGTPVEIKVARGVGTITEDDIESSSNLESSSGVDQDVMIEGFFSKQIARFQGVLTQIKNSYGVKNIITDLRVKKSIKVDVLENFIECQNHGFTEDDIVSFSSDGVLPAGIDSSSKYRVINVNKNSFQLEALGGNLVEIFNKGKSDLMENGGQHYVYYDNDSTNKEKVIIEMNSIAFGAAYNITGFSNDIIEDVQEYGSDNNMLSVLNNLVYLENDWYEADHIGNFFIQPSAEKFWIFSDTLGWVYLANTSTKESLVIYNDPFGWMEKPQLNDDFWWWLHSKKTWAYLYKGGDDFVFIDGSDNNYSDQYNVGDVFDFKLGKTYKVVNKPIGDPGVWISSGGEWSDSLEYESLNASTVNPNTPASKVIAIDSYEYVSAQNSIQGKDSVVVKLFPSNDIDYNAVSEFFIKESVEVTLENKNWGVIFIGGSSFELIDSTHSLGFDGGDSGTADNVIIEMDFSMLSERYFRSQLYRVLSVKEVKGNSYEVIASEYNSSKYSAADSSGMVESPILPLPPQANMSVPSAPSNLRIDLTST